MTSGSSCGEAFAGAHRVRLDPSRPLVVIAPHPDDEVIGFGGALFDHVVAGGRAVIVSITDGERYDAAATDSERQLAGARRRREQLAGLAVLGIGPESVVRLGIPDGFVAEHLEKVADLLQRLLASLRTRQEPLVVVPWRQDRHPDHEATTHAALLGAPELLEVPIWSWHRRDELEPTWQELFIVPISVAAQRAKRAALRRHHSQLVALPNGRPPILSARFLEDFDRTAEVLVA